MDQYEIAHHSAGIVDRSTRGTLIVTGADRASFLQGLLTNDINALVSGRGCYAAWLTPQGRMITDMRVLALDERILLDVRASDAPALAHRLEQLVFAEDVQVADASGSLDQVRVVGPLAAGTVAATMAALIDHGGSKDPPLPNRSASSGRHLTGWLEYQNAVIPVPDAELIVVRDEEFGVPGYDILLGSWGPSSHAASPRPPASAARLRAALDQRGVPHLDHATTETLRIEAGRPLFGVDMDTDTIPLEAGIEGRAISFSKGCYVGQEVIVRVLSRGHGRVVRKLVGLVLEGTRVPARGEALLAGDREIGRVTSATQSPSLGRPIAFGYVHRDFAEPSTRVAVGESRDAAMVTRLPFI